MSLAKGDDSSCRKGKEVSANDPPTKTLCEEASHFESDHFEGEERGRDSGSECPPLIEPWDGTHFHFLIIFSDFSPPSPGRVWLSICRCDTEVSWASLASTIPDLDIHQGTSLLVPILFKFGSSMSLGWKE